MAVSTINERFRAVRKALGVSQRDFAAGIHLSHSFYAKIETGTRNPNERVYELISNKYKVSRDWLSTGRGEMFGENPPDAELVQITEIIRELDPIFRDCIIQQIKLMANLYRKSREQGQDTAHKGKNPQ
jgi:transcriptional regulator with XRE-family HTH domain